MDDPLLTIVSILITGVGVLLCLLSFYLATKSDDYWDEVRRYLEKKDNDRH